MAPWITNGAPAPRTARADSGCCFGPKAPNGYGGNCATLLKNVSAGCKARSIRDRNSVLSSRVIGFSPYPRGQQSSTGGSENGQIYGVFWERGRRWKQPATAPRPLPYEAGSECQILRISTIQGSTDIGPRDCPGGGDRGQRSEVRCQRSGAGPVWNRTIASVHPPNANSLNRYSGGVRWLRVSRGRYRA